MEVSAATGSANVSNEAQVRVLKSQSKQTEAVVGTILQGVSESGPRAPEQTGQNINLKA